MTINYTTLLGLAQPVTGTEANAWGNVVNDQITSLVEDAIANAVSISVSAGNVTLTDNDGATDQARMAVLLITGSPGTSRNIVAPSRSKWYIVRNGSDSSVVVKGSATTGVTIAAGKTALVFWNGTDFATVASNNVNLTTDVTGTLPVANGGTGATTLASGQFLKGAGTSQVTTAATVALASEVSGTLPVVNGGTGATSSTGTGSVVLSTSPTLVTPILGAASATSVALGAGAEGTPSLTATGDLNTGMWFPAADTLAWSTGGGERARIDSGGNVGIGTNSPLSVLHAKSSTGVITSETTAARNSNNNYLSFRDPTGEAGYIGYGGGNANYYVWNAINGVMNFGTNNVTRAQIGADGAQSSVVPGGTTLYPQFACRAWINFDGTAVTNPASMTGVRGSGNVSSVLDNGTGDYTINFTTAMPDANYAVTGVAKEYDSTTNSTVVFYLAEQTVANTLSTSFVRVHTATGGASTATDAVVVCVAVFR